MTDRDDEDLRHLAGQVVAGRYALTRHVGAGAFGAVFSAEHQVLGRTLRTVAVKVSRRTGMSPADAAEMLSESFLLAAAMDELADQEARRHLIQVYDAGLAEDLSGRGYVVTEFVVGGTLADQLHGPRVDAATLLAWAVPVCRALAGLHRLSPPLVHRDLKPDNVLLGVDGVIRLADFGLAARMVSLGHVPGVAGTYDYMAPETSLGTSTPASDVYSMGILLYEGLTGRHPFGHLVPPPDLLRDQEPEWLVEAKAAAPAVPPSTYNPATVSPKLDAIVLRCLTLDPAERYRDAGDLLQALTAKPEADRAPDRESAREKGTRMRDAGNTGAAIAAFRVGLAAGPPPGDAFWLHRELGRTLAAAGDFAGAATSLSEAWQLTRTRPILSGRRDRADLLDEIADAYQGAGNEYQARLNRHLRDRELGGGR